MPVSAPQEGSADRTNDLVHLSDFTGGLNLRGLRFDTAGNEFPASMNVEPLATGGFRSRNGSAPYNGHQFLADIRFISVYENKTSNDVQMYVATGENGDSPGDEGVVWVGTNPDGGGQGSFSVVGSIPASTSPNRRPWRSLQVNERMYFHNGQQQTHRFEGIATTALSDEAWTPITETDPANKNNMFPRADYVTVHQGHIWAASIREYDSDDGTSTGGSLTRFANRVRYSHPMIEQEKDNDGGQEFWDHEQFIDIDAGYDGDWITGIHSVGDRLYVFKNRSTHVIVGWNAENFQVFELSPRTGCVGPDAAYVEGSTIWWFDQESGIYVSTGGSPPRWEFEALAPRVGDLNDARRLQTSMVVNSRKLYVAMPTSDTETAVFIRDLSFGSRVTWTEHEFTPAPRFLMHYHPNVGEPVLLAGGLGSGNQRVMEIEKADVAVDDQGGAVFAQIDAWLATSWLGSARSAIPNPYAEKMLDEMEVWIDGTRGGGGLGDNTIKFSYFANFNYKNRIGPEVAIEIPSNPENDQAHPAKLNNFMCPHHVDGPVGDWKSLQVLIRSTQPMTIGSMLLFVKQKIVRRTPHGT